MAYFREVQSGRRFIARLEHKADLLAELTDLCQRENIRLGKISGIGAISQARLGFYHQENHQYQTLTVDHPMEIASLIGNISIKDGLPFVHAHLTLSNDHGQCFGGHLMTGTLIFAAEVVIEEYLGEEYVRHRDADTGLTLWKL